MASGAAWAYVFISLHIPEPSSITELIMAFVGTNENIGSVLAVDRMKCNYCMCNADIFKQENSLSG